MSELAGKVQSALEAIKSFNNIAQRYGGYYLAFSGGKDSVVCKTLLDMSGVKYDAHYRVTSVDPPELVRFIKEKHPDVQMEIPHDANGRPITMWSLIPQNRTPPTQLMRYCCRFLKEDGGDGRATVTGVRWAESTNRRKNQGRVTLRGGAKIIGDDETEDFLKTKHDGLILVNDNDESRRTIEQCVVRSKVLVNPIIDWTDAEVWEFIRSEGIPYCSLYDEGYHRLGCIGCPMGRRHGMERDFYRYPKYKNLYLMAFQKMLDERAKRGLSSTKMGNTPADVYKWWLRYEELDGQIDLLEEEGQ